MLTNRNIRISGPLDELPIPALGIIVSHPPGYIMIIRSIQADYVVPKIRLKGLNRQNTVVMMPIDSDIFWKSN